MITRPKDALSKVQRETLERGGKLLGRIGHVLWDRDATMERLKALGLIAETRLLTDTQVAAMAEAQAGDILAAADALRAGDWKGALTLLNEATAKDHAMVQAGYVLTRAGWAALDLEPPDGVQIGPAREAR